MNGYINKLLMKYRHSRPSKAQLSPYKQCEVTYGAKEQLTPEEDKIPPLDKEGTKRIQGIVGALLYYAQAVDNKLLFGLSSIRDQQTATTKRTSEAINRILYYSATYTAGEILYRSSDMVLCAHSDVGFQNESKGRSRAGVHSFLFEKFHASVERSSSHSCLDYNKIHVLPFRSITGGTFHYSPR